MHIKRAWNLRFHRYFEVFDYLPIPITTYKPTRNAGAPSHSLELVFEVVEVSKYQISYFAFSYSMMCILNYALCFIGICIR